MEPSEAATLHVYFHNSTRLASASSYGTVRLRDAISADKGAVAFSLAFSHDLTRFALAVLGNQVKTFDTIGACIQTLTGQKSEDLSLAYSFHLMQLASASKDYTFETWNLAGACTQTLAGHTNAPLVVVFSHDSMFLVSSSSDSQIKV